MSKQWQSVSELFEAASRLPFEEQKLFVESSNYSPNIKKEALSLLEHSPGSSFLDSPVGLKWLGGVFSDHRVGDQLGDFELLGELGKGSFGSVFLAHQRSLRRRVALKLTPRVGVEAQTMAKLEHAGIVPVYSEDEQSVPGIKLICMKFVDGTTLDKWLNTRRSVEEILEIFVQVADALAFAHSKGVLHLDVKPGNIMVSQSGKPMLTDFNVSLNQSVVKWDSVPTQFGGTFDYMPPEQKAVFTAEDKVSAIGRVDHRADIYALGKVFRKAMEVLPPQPQAFQGMFQKVVEKSLAVDPQKRFSGAEAFAEAIRNLQHYYPIAEKWIVDDPWFDWMRRHPFLSLLMGALLPQFFGSLINIYYNATQIMGKLSTSHKAAFEAVTLYYNLCVYPICFLLMLTSIRLASKTTRSASIRRKQYLRLPWIVVGISALGWLPGTLLFPIGIEMLGSPLPAGGNLHFFVSFFLSWLVAATYSFIYLESICVRVLYPRLWGFDEPIVKLAYQELKPVSKMSAWLPVVASCIPLSGAALILLFGGDSLNLSLRLLIVFLITLGMWRVMATVYLSLKVRHVIEAFAPQLKRV